MFHSVSKGAWKMQLVGRIAGKTTWKPCGNEALKMRNRLVDWEEMGWRKEEAKKIDLCLELCCLGFFQWDKSGTTVSAWKKITHSSWLLIRCRSLTFCSPCFLYESWSVAVKTFLSYPGESALSHFKQVMLGDVTVLYRFSEPGWLIASTFSCSDKYKSPGFKESII